MTKNCGNHSDSRAVADCSVCAKPLCLMCVEEKPEGTFCSDSCADARRLQLRAQAAVAAAPPGLCAKHPESPSVARCKVCEKGACLLCLVETPEGTFCSTPCLEVLSEVKGWVDGPVEAPVPTPAAPARREDPLPLPAAAPVEPESPAAPVRSGASRIVAVLLAAAALVVIAVVAVREMSKPVQGPVVAVKEPVPKPPEPPKPQPPPESPKPEPVAAKPDPPKPQPPPEPPKPEPVAAKPEPPKPDPVVAKPEPPKPAPKPEPPKPQPPPEPPKPDPVVAKPEPAKPAPKPEPPPKPDPVVAKPEPPKPIAEPAPSPPPKAVPARHLLRAADPWREVAPGAWYRLKRAEAGQETYTDHGLKERGSWYTVVASQTHRATAEPEQHRWLEVAEARSTGELKLEQIDVDLVSVAGGERDVLWVVREGPHAGAVLKRESPGRRVPIAKVEADRLTVKDRSFACLRVEEEEGGVRVRRWISAEVPLPAIRLERDGVTETLVDFGTDWSKRPPFPAAAPSPTLAKESPAAPAAKVEPLKPVAPKPEPPKPAPPPPPAPEDPAERQRKMLSEAAAKVRDATPLYREVAAADPLPSDPADRKALLARAETAHRLLRHARTIYLDARAASDDPAILERRVAQIDSLLAALGKRMALLEEGLR